MSFEYFVNFIPNSKTLKILNIFDNSKIQKC